MVVISRFEGSEQFARNLREVERRVVNRGLKKGFMGAGEVVRQDAARRAPTDTGRLSQEMVLEWQGGRRRRAVVGPSTAAYYGEFQERGTSRHAAQPFLRPALDGNADRSFQTISRELNKVIQERYPL